jgi:Permeases of the drug/metabolite transporter (DMT) superfamily
MVKEIKFSAKMMACFAALLFGASAPLSKLLLNDVMPMPLASLLYLGCGLGVLIFKCAKKIFGRREQAEAVITKKDVPWLAGIILAGGTAAPIILMYSLKATPAATASLLLNFEAVSTALIAAIVFKESLGKRVWASIALITIAAAVLTWSGSGEWGFSLGAVGIIAACGLWGIDNNLTRNVSLKDPLMITAIKGTGAGIVSLILSLFAQSAFPSFSLILLALLLGAFSYGFSIVLFIIAMRHLGAARAGAFFGTAPFIGTIISIVIFGEAPALQFYISLPLMIVGAVLILGERHSHRHIHEFVAHDHKHRHDGLHHVHPHENGVSGEHAHPHVHDRLEHAHPHLPDIHHRHRHKA